MRLALPSSHTVNLAPLLRGGLFIAAYLACAQLGSVLTLAPEFGAFLWPPSGLLLAVLLRNRNAQFFNWVSVGFAADCSASLFMFHFPLWVTVSIAVGNCIEAALGAMLLSRWGQGTFKLENIRSALALVLIAAAGTTLCSTLIGGSAIALYMSQDLFSTWALWWSGDALGVLVIAPIVLSSRHDWRVFLTSTRGLIELAILFALVIFCGRVVLFYPYPIAYVMLLLVIWASLRFSFGVSALAVGAIVVLAVGYAAGGHGPFVGTWSLGMSQFLLQSFAIVLALTGVTMAALSRQVRDGYRKIEDAYGQAEQQIREKTDRLRSSEAELKSAVGKLLEVDKAKDEFVFTLAHELRNPVSSMRNALTIMETAPLENSREIARRIMSRQLGQINSLVEELSDLARIKSGKMTLAKECLNLCDVVQSACESVRHYMAEKNQSFDVVLPGQQVTVMGDRVRLMQAVSNLLSNANRYTQRQGSISIEVVADRACASVFVTDNGPGIPEASLPRIFNMYEQAGYGDRGGLGIGLALVKRIVEAHGGDIGVTSAVGRGSTFFLRIPVHRIGATV